MSSRTSTRVPCDCGVGTHPSMGDVARCKQLRALRTDFAHLGSAFAGLYLQALNGVVCEPGQDEVGRHNCASCAMAWTLGRTIMDKYDLNWGNMYRSGGSFQPGWQD